VLFNLFFIHAFCSMRRFYLRRLLTCLATLFFLWPALAPAAPFAPGNIVVARVGDGTASLNSAATAVFLDEYTPGGVLVQSIDLPTSVNGNNRILTASGNTNAELNMTRSADGHYLVLAGYGAAPGTPSVAASLSTDVSRVIGRIAADGSFDTSTSTGDAFSGASIRAAATADGMSFYAVGGNSGVQYAPLGGVATTQLNAAPVSIRSINTFDGNLYVSTNISPYIGLSQIGTGLPTTAAQSVAVLPGFPASTAGASPYGFYLADLSAAVPGVDVAYVADDRTNGSGGIQKWSLVAGSWVLNGTIASTATSALRGLNGMTAGTTVSLVASSTSGLFLLSDNAGYNAAPSTATLPAAIAAAGANTGFRGLAFAPVALAPTIASFTPASGPVGTTVTVTGTNLTGATALTLNGVAVANFTVVDATTITFTVPAGAASGLIAVTTPGGTATSTGTFTVTLPNPAPTIASLAPATAVAGSAAFTLAVNGTGFVNTSVVSFNGTALTTTYISATQVTAAVPASAVAAVGTSAVAVANPAPGGGTSAAATFTVTTPAPAIASFTPTSGLSGTTVTLTGTDFTGATAVTLNGLAITGFTVVNATTITFGIPAGATSGVLTVTTLGGTATSTGSFTVTLPAPTVAGLAPATAGAGSAAFALTVNGTGFISGSVVDFNSVALATTFVSATQLTAAVPASAIATAGTYNVTVVNPTAAQGGTSAAATFTVTTPAPTIASFTPASGPVGTTVTVTGTNLTGATSATLNGMAVSNFMVMSAIAVMFDVPAGATTGLIAVVTPGGTATSTGTFTVVPPVVTPTLASLAPNSQVVGGPAVTVTIGGTGFTPTATVSFNGATYTPTSSTATSLVVNFPAAALATVGSFPVTVTNSAGTSNALPFAVTALPAPAITSFTPTTGGPGTTVTITGTNFTGATAVQIGSFAVANYTVVSATSITLVLPSGTGSVSGFITVVTPGGTATSASTFNLVSATTVSQALPGLTVFPNPATDRITVALPQPGAATVALRDLTGRLVLAPVALAADQQLYLPASLAAGVYLLEVHQGSVIAVRRVEKK